MPALPLAAAAALVGPAILIVCLGTMVITMRRALRSRDTANRVLKSPLAGGSPTARQPGTAVEIADGGQVPAQELLGALAVVPDVEDLEASTTGDDAEEVDATDDEGTGKRLGLHYHPFHHRDDVWDPTIYEGSRNGHQVFIRLGRNASVRGPGIGMRRLRGVCVVRVAAPEFELLAEGGSLRSKGELPPAIEQALGQIQPSPDVWHDLRVLSGPDGLVASRAVAGDWLGGWIYDLWLLERLASVGGGKRLKNQRLVRAWEPPYEMGKWAPSAFSGLGG